MSDDPVLDHRERLERNRLEAIERRDRALNDQRSPELTPEMRIGVWERLHQVRLPTDPSHRILEIVAKQTALRLDEVLEVQRLRAERQSQPQS